MESAPAAVQPPPSEPIAALEPAAVEDAKDAEIAADAAAAAAPVKQNFKQALIDLAGEFQKSAGLISYDEANKLWAAACDGPGVTETEFNTLGHILSEFKFTKKGRTYLDALVEKKVSGSSLYKQINKVRYDRSCLDLADHLNKDGKIDQGDAKKLWEDVMDGNRVTETERRTIKYICDTMTLTDGAKAFFAEQLGDDKEGEAGEAAGEAEGDEPTTPRKSGRTAAAEGEDTPGRRSARERKAPTKFEPPEAEVTSGKKGKKRKAAKDDGKKKKAKKGSAKKASAKKGSAKKTSAKKAKKADPNAPVYCCGEPYDDSKFYMGCSNESNCLGVEWYHGECVGITEKQSKKIKDWFCIKCTAQQPGEGDEEEEAMPNTSIFDDDGEDDEDGDEYSKRMMEEEDEGEDDEEEM